MADSYVQGSFAFTCNHAEMALIEEALQASYDLSDGNNPAEPSPEFLAVFPATEPEDVWSGFRGIFPDPDFPSFGADFEGGNTLDQPSLNTVYFSSTTDFQPDALAALIQHCCRDTLLQAPIGFEWACSCSRARIGEFGGGACAIFPDHVVFETTQAMLDRVLSAGASRPQTTGADQAWTEHADHPVADWHAEVGNDDTRLGYWPWVAARQA